MYCVEAAAFSTIVFQGNETFDMLGNPPTIFTPTVSNGRLQDIVPITNPANRR